MKICEIWVVVVGSRVAFAEIRVREGGRFLGSVRQGGWLVFGVCEAGRVVGFWGL